MGGVIGSPKKNIIVIKQFHLSTQMRLDLNWPQNFCRSYNILPLFLIRFVFGPLRFHLSRAVGFYRE